MGDLIERLEAENAQLREALRFARIHAPLIRLAPERRFVIATLDAALKAPPKPDEATKVSEWQPIESAPKDERVLAFAPGETGDDWAGAFTAWWAGGDWYTGQAYTESDGHGAGYVRLKYSPTHWMPIPAPPSEAIARE